MRKPQHQDTQHELRAFHDDGEARRFDREMDVGEREGCVLGNKPLPPTKAQPHEPRRRRTPVRSLYAVQKNSDERERAILTDLNELETAHPTPSGYEKRRQDLQSQLWDLRVRKLLYQNFNDKYSKSHPAKWQELMSTRGSRSGEPALYNIIQAAKHKFRTDWMLADESLGLAESDMDDVILEAIGQAIETHDDKPRRKSLYKWTQAIIDQRFSKWKVKQENAGIYMTNEEIQKTFRGDLPPPTRNEFWPDTLGESAEEVVAYGETTGNSRSAPTGCVAERSLTRPGSVFDPTAQRKETYVVDELTPSGRKDRSHGIRNAREREEELIRLIEEGRQQAESYTHERPEKQQSEEEMYAGAPKCSLGRVVSPDLRGRQKDHRSPEEREQAILDLLRIPHSMAWLWQQCGIGSRALRQYMTGGKARSRLTSSERGQLGRFMKDLHDPRKAAEMRMSFIEHQRTWEEAPDLETSELI